MREFYENKWVFFKKKNLKEKEKLLNLKKNINVLWKKNQLKIKFQEYRIKKISLLEV